MWLVDKQTHELLSSDFKPSADNMSAFLMEVKAGSMEEALKPTPNPNRVMEILGSKARINVIGCVTSSPSIHMFILGIPQTLFCDIEAAIEVAEDNDDIDDIEFYFDCPGGEANRTIETADSIRDIRKPTSALIQNAHSAGYWMASQTDKMIANSRGSSVGSIGVVCSLVKPSESHYVEITSTEAPNKRPNPETEEGLNAIREQIDPIHEMFAEAVAAGRGVSVQTVNEKFGGGASFLAEKAIELGMMDGLYKKESSTQSLNPILGATKKMDLQTLKAEHPSVYKEVFALGEEAGKTNERDRIKFHATMGEKSGAVALALKACAEGTAKDDGEMQAEYLTASANAKELNARAQDEADIEENSPAQASEDLREKQLVQAMFAKAGMASKIDFGE